jgi:hypothetical protein
VYRFLNLRLKLFNIFGSVYDSHDYLGKEGIQTHTDQSITLSFETLDAAAAIKQMTETRLD